jgi:hypothetical protein
MTQAHQPDRIQLAMLRRLDRTLQEQYHQSLAEVLAELRMRNVLTEYEPTAENIFKVFLHTNILGYGSSPSVKSIRGAMERFVRGSYGLCSKCGKPIPASVLSDDPTTTVCPNCI